MQTSPKAMFGWEKCKRESDIVADCAKFNQNIFPNTWTESICILHELTQQNLRTHFPSHEYFKRAKDNCHLFKEQLLKDFSAICVHERIWEKLWDIFSRSVYQHQSVDGTVDSDAALLFEKKSVHHIQLYCGYRGVEGGTSDLVNWEGPWMPRGPDLGVLPSLHGVMYKHWIIKLHLSIPLHPVLGRLCQTLSRHLLYLPLSDLPLKLPLLSFSNIQFFGFFCFVSVYCLELSAIFPAVIAHKEWEVGNSKRR